MGLDDLRNAVYGDGKERAQADVATALGKVQTLNPGYMPPNAQGGIEALRKAVEAAPEPDTRSSFTRFYQDTLAKPVTSSVGKIFAAPGEAILQGANAVGLRNDSPEAAAGGLRAAQESGKGIAQYVVPQTPAQAGAVIGTLAAPPLIGTGAAVGMVAPWLARIIGATAGGAAGGALESGKEGAIEGGGTAAVGATLGEGATALGGKVLRSTDWGRRFINRADAARFGEAAGEVAPTLRPGTTANELQRTAEGQGLARMGAAKEEAVQAIEGQMPGQPGAYRVAPHTAGYENTYLGPKDVLINGGERMSLRDANNELSRIGDMMRGIAPLDPRYKDVPLKDAYARVAQEIRDGIEQHGGPAAVAQWDASQAAYRAGRSGVLPIMERPALFKQGEFNAQDAQRWLKTPENRADLAKALGGNLGTGENLGAYNKLVDSITRGAGAGMVDVSAGQAPGLLSGRGSYGMWRAPVEAVRALFPNASSKYVGRVPLNASPRTRTMADVIGERLADEAAR